jgi:hypothetical protein
MGFVRTIRYYGRGERPLMTQFTAGEDWEEFLQALRDSGMRISRIEYRELQGDTWQSASLVGEQEEQRQLVDHLKEAQVSLRRAMGELEWVQAHSSGDISDQIRAAADFVARAQDAIPDEDSFPQVTNS